MTAAGWIQLAVFSAVVLALTKPLGGYLHRVFEGERQPLPRVLGPVERVLVRLCGVDARKEQTWVQYASALLAFSLFSVLIVYAIQRLQGVLPWNPQKFAAVEPGLAFNTAVSFPTNTNWQAYSGESVMSYFTQMAALAWQNFASAAAGIGVALALSRGFTRRPGPTGPRTLGNFWVDLLRAMLYVLLPISIVVALFFVSQGVIQNLSAYREVTTVEGAKQLLALGPVASQEAIKMLGTNGGGFFNANSAHPFENPTPLTNFVQMVLIFVIAAALTNTYGRMAKSERQGWALFGAMSALFLTGALVCSLAEAQPNPALRGLAVDQSAGNLEGKEARFGVPASALFAVVTTDASCGAVNAMHDSFNPLGGLVPLVNLQLGEVIFGGVGAGLYGILVMVVLSVFIAGLMVGRTPEYLGKKIEAREMKLAVLYVLVFPIVVLGFSAWSAVAPEALSSLANNGPHGLSEFLYAYTSGAANNGSAFAGLNANTPFWNLTMGVTMLVGRFFMIVPALAIAGSMVGKKVVPPGPGTFPTDNVLFATLLVFVVVIVGALTFFPALALGPVVEHLANGRVF
jgi:K+-transporting ATPase ATPase A chain